jgi:hypothetical protein
MNVADYIAGSSALVLTVGPWVPAAARLQRRLVPDADPPVAVLARCIIGISGLLVVAELMGIATILRRWPLAAASVVAAAAVAALGRSAPPPRRVRLKWPDRRGDRVLLACVVVCVMSVSAVLLGRDVQVLHTGATDLDSLHYHLTQAAQMAQSHSLDHLHQTASSDGSVYYPFNVELLDAVAMLGPRPDIATLGLNLLFGWLALLACWVIGSRWRVGPAALAAGALLLGLPIVSGASSGPGLNDIPGPAFLLAGIGMLLVAGLPRGERPRSSWQAVIGLAGLSLGLAAGTKLPLLVPVLVLGAGAAVLARGDRLRVAGLLAACGVLTGGFWYLRDWIIVGSPQPSLDLRVAGHGFTFVPYPEVKPYAFTVAHYLGDYSIVRHWFVPGLKIVWSSAWPVVGLLMVAGVVLAIVADRSAIRRVVAVTAIVGFISYLVTPTTAMGVRNQPVLFATNTRYAIPVIALALVLFATTAVLRRYTVLLTVGLTVLTVVVLLLSKFRGKIQTQPGIAAAIVIAAAVAWICVVVSRRPGRLTNVGIFVAVLLVLVAAGGAVQRKYLDRRYVVGDPRDPLYSYVGGLSGQRIGLTGLSLQYPFYGPTFSNRVNYIGVTEPDQYFHAPLTCTSFVRAVAAGHDDYLVIEPLAVLPTARMMAWAEAIPGIEQVLRTDLGRVYRLPAHISGAGCSRGLRTVPAALPSSAEHLPQGGSQ